MNSRITSVLAIVVFFFSSISLLAQEKTITGTVTGADDGLTMPGVSIVIVGSQTGTSTDFDGKFEITANEGDVLQFNFMGYADATITVGAANDYNVTMQVDAQQLEDVVVTALGIKREKKALGYAVQDVKGDEITKASNGNVVGALQGKVAGVQITTNSGAVGASSTIKIRGDKSFTGGSSPLFVVDGVPISNATSTSGVTDMGNAAQDIDPENIASMSVLKGPSATSLYGSRGANGVIIITTKKGTKNKGIGVSYTGSLSFDNVYILPNYQNQYGQGIGGAEFNWKKVMEGKDPSDPSYMSYTDWAATKWAWSADDTTDESWGARLDAGVKTVQLDSPLDADGNRIPSEMISRPDNIKNFYETAVSFTNSVAMTGGNDVATGRLIISHTKQNGTSPNTDQSKINIGWNTSVNLSKKLKFSVNGNYNITKNDNLPKQGSSLMNPLYEFNNWFGRQTNVQYLKDHYLETVTHADGSTSPLNWMNGYAGYNNNPYWNQYQNLTSRQRNRLFGSISATYSIVEGIDLMARVGTDYISEGSKTNFHSGTKGTLYSQQNPVNGSYTQSMNSGSETNADLMLLINKEIGENISFSSTLGGNYRRNASTSMFMGVANLTIPDFYATSAIDGYADTDINKYEKVVNSAFATANLGFRRFLFLDLSYRQDWSSTLPSDNWSYGYPAATASIIFTDAFDMNKDIMQYGKFRIGYAKAGNDTSPYSLYPVYSTYGPAYIGPDGTVNFYRQSSVLPTVDLKPENTYSFETGAEFKFFNNRLGLDVTYYSAVTENQIMYVKMAPSTGYSSWKKNAGKIKNSGFEIIAYGTAIKSDNFSWDITLNWSNNKNEVLELNGEQNELILNSFYKAQSKAIVGGEMGTIWGRARKTDNNGNFLVDQNGQYILTDDQVQIGKVNPDFIGGFRNTFNYKNITLSALIDFRVGGDVVSRSKIQGQRTGLLESTTENNQRVDGYVAKGVYAEDGIDVNGDAIVAGETNATAIEARSFWKTSREFTDMGIIDGSFIKLREVTLGYNFSRETISKLHLQGASLSLFARNIALLYTDKSNDVHIDPEVAAGTNGYESFNLAPSRTLGVKLNVNF